MSIQELLDVVTPPASPEEVGSQEAWSHLEAFMGTSLPPDYYDFGRNYGSGGFMFPGICLWPINPFSSDFLRQIYEARSIIESLQEETGYPYKAYPRKKGLIAWASDDNGNMFCWQVEGSSENWPVVVIDESWEPGKGFSRFEMTMTSFLASVFGRQLSCPPWSDIDVNAHTCRFESRSPPQISTEWSNLVDLYIENGNQADFWVLPNAWADSHIQPTHVRKVCGKAKGPLKNLRFTRKAGAIVDVYDRDDGSVQYGEHSVPAIDKRYKLISEPANVNVVQQPKWKSICELYVENANRAGFWVQYRGELGSHCLHLVIALNGKTDGPLTGTPPAYNRPLVTCREFRDGAFHREWTSRGVESRRWARVDTPDSLSE